MFFKKKNKFNEKYRFNFEKYPELLEKYEVYMQMRMKVVKSSMGNSKAAGKKLDDAIKERRQYSRTILAKAIFETLSEEKPPIHKLRNKEECFEWDERFNKPFEEMDDKMRDDLVGLLDGDFVYELPEEYYNY